MLFRSSSDALARPTPRLQVTCQHRRAAFRVALAKLRRLRARGFPNARRRRSGTTVRQGTRRGFCRRHARHRLEARRSQRPRGQVNEENEPGVGASWNGAEWEGEGQPVDLSAILGAGKSAANGLRARFSKQCRAPIAISLQVQDWKTPTGRPPCADLALRRPLRRIRQLQPRCVRSSAVGQGEFKNTNRPTGRDRLGHSMASAVGRPQTESQARPRSRSMARRQRS